MFDVDLDGGESYRESRSYRPGELAVLADLPWGRLGLTICYDLRFPALYRALAEAGATFLAIPSAFTRQTGEAHWHVLMRARAIENGCVRVRGRAGRRARERPRDLRPFAGGRSLGPRPRRRRHRAGRGVRRDRPGRSRRSRARAFPRCSTAGASKSWSRWRSRRTCTWSEADA